MARWILAALVVNFALFALATHQAGRLVEPSLIDPALWEQPIQGPTDRPPFTFRFRGVTHEVMPVATYEISGLVVTHNDISSWFDIYHDADAVDTLDVALVYGDNLKRRDYLDVSFSSGSWTAYFQYPAGVRFTHHEFSNNHLITDSPSVRARIGRLHVGDQIRIRGLLINHRSAKNPGAVRKTSITRMDTGGTACEVVFVESLEVLRPGTPRWYQLRALTKTLGWVLGAVVLLLALRGFVRADPSGS